MLSRERANQVLVAALVLVIALAVVLARVMTREPAADDVLVQAMADETVRADVVAELVDMSYGVYDAHPDPDVGRVFQPDIERVHEHAGGVATNGLGLREREFDLPKPDGVVRVVLLGDSYVFGNKVQADERLGVHLENFLRERAGVDGVEVECLHVGIPSWNVLSECAWARRMLADLRPDLLLQVVVPNDLDDLGGVRGFGSLARFSPQHRERGSTVLTRTFSRRHGFATEHSFLLDGRDWESRTRYAEANRAIRDLASAVEAEGGRYALVLNWMNKLPVGMRLLADGLRDDQVAPLPFSLFEDPSLRISAGNGHWNPAGHRHVALHLYDLVRERGLLSALELAAWDEAASVRRTMEADVRAELADAEPAAPPPLATLDFRRWGLETLSQIYGGIDTFNVKSYASLVLAGGGSVLQIEGQHLDTASMAGATVRVFAEDVEVAALPHKRNEQFRVRIPLPAGMARREVVNVRLVTDDWILGGAEHRETFSLMVATIGIVD